MSAADDLDRPHLDAKHCESSVAQRSCDGYVLTCPCSARMYPKAASTPRWSLQAARYQMIVMFLVCSNSGLCSVATVYGAAATVIDGEHRLRLERLSAKQPRDARMAGAAQWLWAAVCTESCRKSVFCGMDRHGTGPDGATNGCSPSFCCTAGAEWRALACMPVATHFAEGLGLVRRSQHVAGTSSREGPCMARCRRGMRTQQTSKRACH